MTQLDDRIEQIIIDVLDGREDYHPRALARTIRQQLQSKGLCADVRRQPEEPCEPLGHIDFKPTP